LAIEMRSSEVWKVLGAVKNDFGKFGDMLDGVKKKLEQASNTIDDASRKSKTIERKLRDVEELPAGEADSLLLMPSRMQLDGESELEAGL
jgi:DNA recombination protein RmuC